MATLGTNALGLIDWAKRTDPDGKTARIVEMLGQTNEILKDMLWIEGNLPTGHRTTVRTALPSVEFRLLNQGVNPSKSTTAQMDEGCAILEAWSEVDKELAVLGGDIGGFRLSEGQAFIEAMSQKMATTVFYGNKKTNPEQFDGLTSRYDSQAGVTGENIILGEADDGGVDYQSVWLIVWGANTLHGIFPKGSKAGLTHEDLGEATAETTAGVAGSRLRVYQDHFIWKCGLAVRDWRYAVRIGNIDRGSLSNSAPDLPELLIKAIHRIPSLDSGRAAFYMNRSVLEYMDLQKREDVRTGGGLAYSNVDGERVLSFRGIPVRKCDALVDEDNVGA